MKVKKIDILHRFLPLAWHVFFIIFIAFHMTKEGMNIVVNQKYNYLIYLNIALMLAFFIGETIWAKKIISKWRIGLFLLFLILAVSLPPLMNDWKLFNTFIVLSSACDLLIIMLKMVKDSFFNEERLQNQKLPVNQFTDKRKIISRIVNLVSFIILFVISFIIFYYNEVSLEAILMLTFVGIIIASIGEILRLSISLKPMEKYLKRFDKSLDFNSLEKSILALDEEKLHEETRNMMYIELWLKSSFVDLAKAEYYEAKVTKPNNPDNLKRYHEALFWYLINTKQYDLILTQEHAFRHFLKKKEILPYINLIKGGRSKLKIKKNANSISLLKQKLYLEIEKYSKANHGLTVAIMYESVTGNTKALADSIALELGNRVIYNGKPNPKLEADLYFLGSWTDNGGEQKKCYLDDFKNKNIALFGTCGYLQNGYENRIYERALKHIDSTNKVLGHFYSLGKMKKEAKDKFVSIIKANPSDADLNVLESDYDLNQNHPNEVDLNNVRSFATRIYNSIK